MRNQKGLKKSPVNTGDLEPQCRGKARKTCLIVFTTQIDNIIINFVDNKLII